MNKPREMLNMDKVKEMITNCPENETVILMPHYSINKPKYDDFEESIEASFFDIEEVEQEIGHPLIITDYDDLVVDPHGILEC